MKKFWLIFTIVLLVLVGAGIVLYIHADKVVTETVNTILAERLAKLTGETARYETVRVSLMRGHIDIGGVYFRSDTINLTGNDNGVELSLKELQLTGIKFRHLLKTKQLKIEELQLIEPSVTAYVGGKKKVKNEPIELQDTINAEPSKASTTLKTLLDEAGIHTLNIRHANVSIKNITNHFALSTDDVNLVLHDLHYSLRDSAYYYNDSIYLLAVGKTDVIVPTGFFRATFDELKTENGGALHISNLHAFCPIAKNKLADRKGKQPVTWTDLRFSSIETSPTRFLAMVREKAINIDKVTCKGKQISLYRDNRYEPKEPYGMPQDGLLKMKLPLNIKQVALKLDKFMVEVCMPTGRVGTLQMHNIRAAVDNVTNKQGQTIVANMHLQMGEQGVGDLCLALDVNKECTFTVDADIKDLTGGNFDDFLRPLFGATASCDIHAIKTHFTGNKQATDGDFLMLYDDLKVRAYKDESPIEALSKNAGLINAFGGIIIQDKNPLGNAVPKPVTLHHERNPKKNFAAYIVGNIIDGVMETALPGFVVKKINKKQQAKQSGNAEDTNKKARKTSRRKNKE